MKKLAILMSSLSLLLMNGVVMAQVAVDCVPGQTCPNIPEPSLLSLLGIGAVGLIALRLRKRK